MNQLCQRCRDRVAIKTTWTPGGYIPICRHCEELIEKSRHYMMLEREEAQGSVTTQDIALGMSLAQKYIKSPEKSKPIPVKMVKPEVKVKVAKRPPKVRGLSL